jgi:hypothetical protein
LRTLSRGYTATSGVRTGGGVEPQFAKRLSSCVFLIEIRQPDRPDSQFLGSADHGMR